MASSSLVDHYNSRINFDKLNPLIRSAYNITSDYDEYKQKLLAKIEYDNRENNNNTSFLDSIENIRQEQRVRLAQVEHDYYNQKKTLSFDVPYYPQIEKQKQETMVTSRPSLPSAAGRSPSPVFLTEEQIPHHIHDRPMSRRHDDHTQFGSHQTYTGNTTTELVSNHVEDQIQTMWNEFELDDYLERRK